MARPRTAPTIWPALALLSALFGCAWLPWMAAPGVRWALVVASVIGAIWLGFIVRIRPCRTRVVIRRPHWVQAIAHGSIFAYWGAYVDAVYPQIPLILAQVLFAYALDMLLSWSRGRDWVVGFGPFPIVGSTNLFLWFHADVFTLQLLMVAGAFLSREWLRWNRDGRSVHIFNPSGFGLSVASVLVIATGTTEWTWGSTIATTLIEAPLMYEWIFVAGVVVQLLFGVCLVTLSAAAAVAVGGWVWFSVTGDWYFENTYIPVAVFLGMHLLITDPVTSPKNNGGKALFGALYGLAVFPLYSVLLAFGVPSFYDKLLQVPILNLMVPWLERAGRALHVPQWRASARATNLAHVSVWAAGFFVLRGELRNHPGQQPAYWAERCMSPGERACQNLVRVHDLACQRGSAVDCLNLGERFMQGKGVPRIDTRAADYFELACATGHASGCGMVAVAYEQGHGRAPDQRRAANARVRACELDDADACVTHAARLMDAQDAPAAATLLDDACERGLSRPCAVLAFMAQQGQGVPVDRERARALYQRACDGGFTRACELRAGMGPG